MNAIQTRHGLDFEACDDPFGSLADLLVQAGLVHDDDAHAGIPWMLFRIGTCEGKWRATPDAYEILAVVNNEPGNGHFEDVLEWFEYACRRDGKSLRFVEFMNQRFRRHLIAKRGFLAEGRNAVKQFRQPAAFRVA